MFGRFNPYAKAIVAFVGGLAAELVAILGALPEGSGLSDISTVGWLTFVVAAAALAGSVFFVPNTDPLA